MPNTYESVVVSGGNVQLGDTYTCNNKDDPVRQRYEQIVSSTSWPQMSLRKNQIVDSYPDTFSWVFDHDDGQHPWDNFMQWLSGSDTTYWVAGKPGSGKSTLMKFLASHSRIDELLCSSQHRQPVILYFYFWASGMEMQRSLQSCLRTLLNQLLHALPREIEDLLKRQWDPLWTMTANKRTIDDWSIR